MMQGKDTTFRVFTFTVGMVILALLSIALMRWLEIPIGSFIDWLVGLITFVWLVTIVTVPWNIYFEAKEVIEEAKTSYKLEIKVEESQVNYAKRLSRFSLGLALFLHLASTITLYWIAYINVSDVGYFGAGAALLLTFLRPFVRAYEYVSTRLSSIRQEITYPREDIQELRYRVSKNENNIKFLLDKFDEQDSDSWLNQWEDSQRNLEDKLRILEKSFQESEEANIQAHEKIARETRHAVAQLSEDGKFIDNIVEIIRFIKKVN